MQSVTKKLYQELLTYWQLQKKMQQHNNIFKSYSLNIGYNIVVKVHAFSNMHHGHLTNERANGILLMVTTVGENYLQNKTTFFDLYFDKDCSNVKYATYSGHGSTIEKIGGREMLRIMKDIHGFKASGIGELYRKMKLLNLSIV